MFLALPQNSGGLEVVWIGFSGPEKSGITGTFSSMKEYWHYSRELSLIGSDKFATFQKCWLLIGWLRSAMRLGYRWHRGCSWKLHKPKLKYISPFAHVVYVFNANLWYYTLSVRSHFCAAVISEWHTHVPINLVLFLSSRRSNLFFVLGQKSLFYFLVPSYFQSILSDSVLTYLN